MLHMDCDYCNGTVNFRRGPGECDTCGMRYVISTRGDSLYVNPIIDPNRRRKGKKRSGSKKSKPKGTTSNKGKSFRNGVRDFVAIAIFIAIIVLVASNAGGI